MNLPYHAKCHRLYRRAGQTAHNACQDGLLLARINGHAKKRVDKRNGISACCLGRLRNLGDVGDVGSELYEQRALRALTAFGHNLLNHGDIGAERKSAAVNIGARDVHLVRIDVVRFLKRFDDGNVLIDAVARNVHDNGCVLLAKPRQIAALQDLNARVLQADGVQHAAGRFGDARRVVSSPPVKGDAFCGNRTEQSRVNERRILTARGVRSRCRGNRVLHRQSA